MPEAVLFLCQRCTFVAAVAPVAVLPEAVLFLCQRCTFVVAVAAAAVALVVVPAAVALAVALAAVAPAVALVAAGPAVAVVALVEQQPARLASAVAEVYSAVDPCVGVDAITNDSSGKRLYRICHTHVTLCGNCRLCGAVDAEISRASVQNHDRNRDKCVVLVSGLIPLEVMFASRHACD